MHDCAKVHDHLYYVLRANTGGIPSEEYCDGEFYCVIVIFNNGTDDDLWDFLEQNYDECRKDWKELTDDEFWSDFFDIHPINIGFCLCNTVNYGPK